MIAKDFIIAKLFARPARISYMLPKAFTIIAARRGPISSPLPREFRRTAEASAASPDPRAAHLAERA